VIRYRYAQHLGPLAPFVNVTLSCPQTGNRVTDIPAQIDSGADRTVLPDQVVQELGLVEDGRLLFLGFAAEVVELPIFLIEVHIHDLAPVTVRAALGEHEPYILLGRDVLNLHRILLDGPQLTLEIG
jgi:predicted aspartyl protease